MSGVVLDEGVVAMSAVELDRSGAMVDDLLLLTIGFW